jgi:uncharacterized repeat protein (TIGR03803 family)
MRRNTPSAGLSALTIAFALVLSCGALDAAPTEQVVYTFHGSPGGALPEGSLIFDAAGHLVGTTTRGGTGGACSSGCGTIFRLTRGAGGTWKETVLHSFNLSDGAYPANAIVFDAAGNLFGTTGVAPVLGNAYGLFNKPSGWQIDVLHEFRGGRDGSVPSSTPVFDKHGNLFATTSGGGNGTSGGGGTVFELTPQPNGRWKETIIHRFGSAKDGAGPQGGLLIDGAGNLYGTTLYGGNTVCTSGCGVVFELSPAPGGQWREKILHAFSGGDGSTPLAGVFADRSGNLYTTGSQGGHFVCLNAGCGTVIELSPIAGGRWKSTVLHVFTGKDGGGPSGNMAVDDAGHVYGSTVIGGNISACPVQHGCGVVFKLAPGAHGTWTYSVLHKFNNGLDGILPTGLVMGTKGNLYGTTISGGGTSNFGVVFEVTP